MERYTFTLVLTILCFVLGQQNMFSQSARSFTYGGNKGTRNGGKIQIHYMLQSGERGQKLEGNVIDLNDHPGNLKLIIQLSGLEVGLNKTATGPRNSDHFQRFYMKAAHQSASALRPIGNKTIQIGSKVANYGALSNRIVYRISPIIEERTAVVKIKTEIVDANSGRTWKAVPITIRLTLLPRNSDIENSVWKQLEKLWTQVQESDTAEDKKTLLERCNTYRNNCEQELFPCRHKEDVLYYMINLSEGNTRKALIKEYKTNYRKGKYLEAISKIPEVSEPEIPMEAGARLDVDAHYLVVNGVKGGKKPYWVKLFNAGKGDSLSLKSINFAREYVFIDVNALNVPEGFYTVKVTDKNGNVFVEKDQIYVDKAFQWPPTVKLSGILLLLGGAAFAYKKFIHF